MKALPAVLLLLAGLAPLGMALGASLMPLDSGPVAAVFPPWWNITETAEAAGAAGALIRFGAFPFIVIVSAGDRAQLTAHGAWLLLDPVAFGGCSASAS